MKYIKKLLIAAMLVICAVSIGRMETAYAADPTTTPTPTVTPTAAPTPAAGTTEITKVEIRYDTEDLLVTSTKPLYYALLKKQGVSTCKLAELKAAAVMTTGQYIIDFSTISASKAAYIGLTTSTTADSTGLVGLKVVELVPTQKKAVYTVNWGAESNASGTQILYSVELTNSEGTLTKYKNTPGTGETAMSQLKIDWKKGVNGNWADIATLNSGKWQSMLISGTTIYFRTGAVNNTTGVGGLRYGKEVKVKISTAKAPSVKLDVSKLSIALKNGMQFRKQGTTEWKTILPYNAKATVNEIIRSKTGTFDPMTESTTAKVSTMLIDDLKKSIGFTEKGVTTGALTLEVRTAATSKKPASSTSIVKIPGQASAPVAAVSKSGEDYKIGTITKGTGDPCEKPGYEFFITTSADIASGKINYSTVKWSAVKDNTIIKAAAKSKYKMMDGTAREYKPSDMTAVMLLRRKGVAGSAKAEALLASECLQITMPSSGSATPTPTAAPTPTP